MTVKIALYASYQPLHELFNSEPDHREHPWEFLTAQLEPPYDQLFEQLLEQQIHEPEAERKILSQLTARAVADLTSQQVRSQYEANPYPRWTHTDDLDAKPFSGYIQQLFPHLESVHLPLKTAPLDILVAGCGTGKQAIDMARRFTHAQVLAIDFSLTSLAYAMRQAEQFDCPNLTFLHCDLLDLSSLGRRFDVIACSGVLHHLREPLVGWQALTDCLRPQGWMKIALYSQLARQHITAARDWIAQQGYSATPDDIRRCRQDLINLSPDHPARLVTRAIDFYTLSECRDLIFHVQEHQFTLPQIEAALKELGLNFIGFDLPNPEIAHQTQFPNNPTQDSLAYWHQLEQAHPQTFVGMYQFWVQKPPA